MDTESTGGSDAGKLGRAAIKQTAKNIIIVFVQLAIMLAAAGKIGWVNAWIFAGAHSLAYLVGGAVMMRANPGLLKERSKLVREDTKFFDKVFYAIGISVLFAIVIHPNLYAKQGGTLP